MGEIGGMAFTRYFDDAESRNDLIFDNRHWFGISFVLDELFQSNQASFLLTQCGTLTVTVKEQRDLRQIVPRTTSWNFGGCYRRFRTLSTISGLGR